MTAIIINCQSIANKLLDSLKEKFDIYKQKGHLLKVVLLLIGESPINQILISKMMQAFDKAGVLLELKMFSGDTSDLLIVDEIKRLNQDSTVCGIGILKFTGDLNSIPILAAIDFKKDIECISLPNLGMFYLGKSTTKGCTARAVLEVAKSCDQDITGKHVVVIGRSFTVGKAIALSLLQENCTVTICHSYTKNLAKITSCADIVVSAVGKAKFLTEEYFSSNQIVIDVGVNIEKNGKDNHPFVCGDVDFENVKNKVQYITPVPGLGEIAIAHVLSNVLDNINKEY